MRDQFLQSREGKARFIKKIVTLESAGVLKSYETQGETQNIGSAGVVAEQKGWKSRGRDLRTRRL